jgi:protein SERAC1
VIKEALCISSHSSDYHLKQADRCTVGIAFLGTPHRGSGLATLANVIANTLKIVMTANTDVLRGLKRDSKVLAEVEDSFGEWLKNKGVDFNITCFYEELELLAMGFVSLLQCSVEKLSRHKQLLLTDPRLSRKNRHG